MMLSSLFYALIYVVVRGLAESFAVNQIVFSRRSGIRFHAAVAVHGRSRRALHAPDAHYLWRMLFSYVGAVAGCTASRGCR